MKRISIAEQTLKHQIDQFTKQRDSVVGEIDLLNEQIAVYNTMINSLTNEQTRLRSAREAASARNTPKT